MVVDDGLRSGSDRRAVRRRAGRRVRGVIDASEPWGAASRYGAAWSTPGPKRAPDSSAAFKGGGFVAPLAWTAP